MQNFLPMLLVATALSSAAMLGEVVAQNTSQPPRSGTAERLEGTVGQSGTANNSGMQRSGPNPQAGNSAAVPPPQTNQPAGNGISRTEGPSLETREVGPNARPDQTQPRR